ncbi:4-hydroxyphenylacetate 3-hydroxylase N-terminal domain-containing protein [Leifsonia kafniensis]|uniref:4-hydroxyphenylacetate 3-hydroxylase N-terminal domain-containing protein n=2 Tax=Leifsonia kafniensis TaxID=475957 RepID=A0ABP7KM04_9MICO
MGFGWMGRSPDYKASLLTSLGADPEFFGQFADNARRWYTLTQEQVTHLGHAVVHPPVDRDKAADQVRDVFLHVEREVDGGVILSGAKVVATGAPTTQYVYVSHSGTPITDDAFALTFFAPLDTPGVKLFARSSYEENAARTSTPFDSPLSSRLDENDAILIFDNAFIPWENFIAYGVEGMNKFEMNSGWPSRAIFQAATRMGVKLEFLAGALSLALDITGAGKRHGARAGLGEIISMRSAVNAMRDGMIENAHPAWGGTLDPDFNYGAAYATLAPGFFSRARQIIHTCVSSGLIYLNSSALDFENPEMRRLLDRFLRGSNGNTALDRSRTMKLLWDAVGSEFASRHELYELNYFGQPEFLRLGALDFAEQDGSLEIARDLARSAMDEHDLSGWTRSDMIGNEDIGPRSRRSVMRY